MTLGNFFVPPNSGERVSEVVSDKGLSEFSPGDSSLIGGAFVFVFDNFPELMVVPSGFRRSLSVIDEGVTTGF